MREREGEGEGKREEEGEREREGGRERGGGREKGRGRGIEGERGGRGSEGGRERGIGREGRERESERAVVSLEVYDYCRPLFKCKNLVFYCLAIRKINIRHNGVN